MAASITEDVSSRLEKRRWYSNEVKYVLESGVKIVKDELIIATTDIPVQMCVSQLAGVSRLDLHECNLCINENSVTDIELKSDPSPKLYQLRLENVTGVGNLSKFGVQLPKVKTLIFEECSDVSLPSPQVFPSLTTLKIWRSPKLQPNQRLPQTVDSLVLGDCERVQWSQWQSVGPYLHQFEVKYSTLVVETRPDKIIPWPSLENLRLVSSIETTAGKKLYERDSLDFTLVKDWLAQQCPNAEVWIDKKLVQKPKSDEEQIKTDRQMKSGKATRAERKGVKKTLTNFFKTKKKVEGLVVQEPKMAEECSGSNLERDIGNRSTSKRKGLFRRFSTFLKPTKSDRINTEIKHPIEDEAVGSDATPLSPEMQQMYETLCQKGSREVFQTRLMIIGHYRAGKTSVKRSLLHEAFVREHLTTDGLDNLGETVVVNVERAINWRKVYSSHKEEFTTQTAKQLKLSQVKCEQEQISNKNLDKNINIEEGAVGGESSSTVANKFVSGPDSNETEQINGTSTERPNKNDKFDRVKGDVIARLSKLEEQGDEVQFTVWDFGGQHIYYTTHQTFLTFRAVYLLVMDLSRGLNDVVETHNHPLEDIGLPRTALDFLDFWLNSVHTHLAQRHQNNDHCDPPVIIVCTKKDTYKDMDKRDYLVERFMSSVHQHLCGKPYYHHVRDIIAVSNCDTNDEGMDKLRLKILEVAASQPYWGEKRPTKWLLLVDELRQQARLLAEPVVTLSDVHQAAKACGVMEDEVNAFLKFHHNLGDLVHFDEPETRDMVVLSPQWLASEFSKVITQDKILEESLLSSTQIKEVRQGLLSEETTRTICATDQGQTFVKIMEKFHMIVPCQILKGDQRKSVHLVPCLLPRVAYQISQEENALPKIHFKFASKSTQGLRYHDAGGFVPHGLYHRIVSLCCRIKGWSYHESMIFYDYMVIDVGSFCFSLHMVNNGITMSAFKCNPQLQHGDQLLQIRKRVESMIETITTEVFPDLQSLLYLECNCFVSDKTIIGQSVVSSYEGKTSGYIPFQNIVLGNRVVCEHHRMFLETTPWIVWFGASESSEIPSTLSAKTKHPFTLAGENLLSELDSNTYDMDMLLSAHLYKVQDEMMLCKLLHFEDHDDIESETTTTDKNRRLIKLVLSRVKTTDDYEAARKAICKGLCLTSQVCPFSTEHTPATEDQKEAILACYHRLLEDMEVYPVLYRLHEEQIIDTHIIEQVKARKTRRERVNALLLFIDRTHSKAHNEFITILKETNCWIFDDE